MSVEFAVFDFNVLQLTFEKQILTWFVTIALLLKFKQVIFHFVGM